MRYQFVQQYAGQFRIALLCRVMQVSKSGYYAWRDRPKSTRSQGQKALVEQIRVVYRESRNTYGSPRVHQELVAGGVRCSENRVARLMRRHGIRAEPTPRFVVTTHSDHELPVAPNVLEQDFTAKQVNERWASDITYIWTRAGWLYLAVVLDLCSRRVVGWSMQPSMHKELVIQALESALGNRRPEPSLGLVHHSDRGSQYASHAFRERLEEAGIVCSMSRKGNCWDNAMVESFFSTLKRELVHRCVFEDREEARLAIFEYIEVWYNRQRRHSALGYVSPAQFEANLKERERTQAHQRPLASGLTGAEAPISTLPIAA